MRGAAAAATVTRVAQRVVTPSAATPSGQLPLSWLDRYPTQRALIESLHVFKGRADAAESPAAAIERAIAKALVSYYPIAGRLAESDDGELVVNCTGEGVWFIEATASVSLEEVDYLEYPLMVAKDDLLPHPTYPISDHHPEDSLILLVQVTQFACGGFVVGFRFSHAVADGPGAAQFMTAVGELARDAAATSPSLPPAWGRDVIPRPPVAAVGPLPIPTELRLQYLAMDISTDYIDHFKSRFLSHSGGHRCSAFEVLIAKTWQARTRAAGFSPESPIHVCFAMNARPVLGRAGGGAAAALPAGFYGNCYYIMRVTASAGEVADASVYDVVRLIREGKKRLPADFARWSSGEAGARGEDPYRITSDYRTLLVSDWSRLGFAEVDYGWGNPVHVVPLTNLDYIATCILVRPSAHKPGARLITQCVAADGVDAFHKEMMRLD
uniref:Uncharacterized protein n=1 Tax=Leersia perrieri TaxID=77586 RepID=A0A0D9WRS1_9ORYZ